MKHIVLMMPLALLAAPVAAQGAGAEPQAGGTAETPPVEARIARLEGELARAKRVAENARQQVARLRAELALKDELIALGIERNAQLYELAVEVIEKGLSKRSVEPFLQTARVKMENLQQDYVDRAHAVRIYPGTPPPSLQKQNEQSAQNN
ncbi:hypothetical protein [Pelagerythrobacter rhizovicinus]|uniref:Uncharacterized protein n=1 Tax=Pelagerythrobacter rhizovicinus TaxID=2268576 RepID=A0A4Q2KRL7_9SPHN|nr:hypothetical protein [Pelagerythrobacter rhizovicinus]RXZ66312.1 hypothetical protein ETX26_06345 [Pelagerythrobacter rhizovicinus]